MTVFDAATLQRMAAENPTLHACIMGKAKGNAAGGFELPEADLAQCRAAHELTVRMRGLGDAVAVVAKPIARAVDAVAGTELEQCGGCARRQAWLNSLLPFKP